MLFDQNTIDALKDVVGWKDHYNLNDIPALPASLTSSESSLYVQDAMSRLVTLPNIKALLPDDYPLEQYLETVRENAIKRVLSQVAIKNSLENTGKDLISAALISASRLPYLPITNEGRFVGISFTLGRSTGIRLVINRIGLYLSEVQNDLTLYLFNSNQSTAISTFTYTSNVAKAFSWLEQDITMDLDDGSNNTGAVWYLGYYQDDLTGNAIKYEALNWASGYCGSCGNKYASSHANYKAMSRHVTMNAFYIASSNVPAAKTERFDVDDVVEVYDNNFGFNLSLTIKCHLGQFWKDNRLQFANAIQRMCTYLVLEDYLASNQSSGAEQNVQRNAYTVINPPSESKQRPYVQQVESAIKSVRLNLGNVSSNPCLPCARKGASFKAF